MDWAGRRRLTYAGSILLVFALLLAGGWYFFIYTPPSCFDGIQNQDEVGIDCDGSCSKMCSPSNVNALWTRAVKVAEGVYHGVALVKNPLGDAKGSNLPYTMSLYDTENVLVAERRGTLNLNPGETRVVFESNIVTGSRIPFRAFTSLGDGVWDRMAPVQNLVAVIPNPLDQENRLLSAVLENTTAAPVNGVIADALLYDAEGILVAASETRIDTLAGRERRVVTFTWGIPFARPVTTADILVRLQHAPSQ